MWKPSCVGCRLVSTVATAPLRLIASRCPSLYLFMSTNHLNWARYMSQAHFPIDQLAPHCHLPRYAVSAVRSCRSFWRSSFYSHSCLSSNSLYSSVHRPVRDPSTALNCPSTAACTKSKPLSAADTCSSVSSCFRANLSMCSTLTAAWPSPPAAHSAYPSFSSKAVICSSSLLSALVAILCQSHSWHQFVLFSGFQTLAHNRHAQAASSSAASSLQWRWLRLYLNCDWLSTVVPRNIYWVCKNVLEFLNNTHADNSWNKVIIYPTPYTFTIEPGGQ